MPNNSRKTPQPNNKTAGPGKRPITKHDGRPRSQFETHSHAHRTEEKLIYETPAAHIVVTQVSPHSKQQRLALCAAFSNITGQETTSLRIHYTGLQIGNYQRQMSNIMANKDENPADTLIKNLEDLLTTYPNSPFVALRQVFLYAGLNKPTQAKTAHARFMSLCQSSGMTKDQVKEIERALTRS